jgi:hypothetical protein
MKNEMRKLWFTVMLFIGTMAVNAQLSQHGLLLNGGIGSVKNESRYYRPYYYGGGGYDFSNPYYCNGWTEYEYKSGFSAGYRLRFKMPARKSFHYDLDLNAGAKILRSAHFAVVPDPPNEDGAIEHFTTVKSATSPRQPYYYTSIGGTVNYSLIKHLSIGLGIEPTLYLNRESKYNSDIPIVVKAAYSFGVAEIGISGKYGLSKAMNSMCYSSGKIREVQLSLFIPLKTK